MVVVWHRERSSETLRREAEQLKAQAAIFEIKLATSRSSNKVQLQNQAAQMEGDLNRKLEARLGDEPKFFRWSPAAKLPLPQITTRAQIWEAPACMRCLDALTAWTETFCRTQRTMTAAAASPVASTQQLSTSIHEQLYQVVASIRFMGAPI